MPVAEEEYLLSITDADCRLGVFLLLPFLFFRSDRDCGTGQDEAPVWKQRSDRKHLTRLETSAKSRS